MKAISLWQPWATLVVSGHKKRETRSWETKFRGTILIHAAKRWSADQVQFTLTYPCFHIMQGLHVDKYRPWDNMFSFGAIIGCADITECRKIRRIDYAARFELHTISYTDWTSETISEQEYSFGDYKSGRYVWKLENPIIFQDPIPCRGKQRLFEYDSNEIDYIIFKNALRPA